MKTNPHRVLLGMEDGGGRDGWMDKEIQKKKREEGGLREE